MVQWGIEEVCEDMTQLVSTFLEHQSRGAAWVRQFFSGSSWHQLCWDQVPAHPDEELLSSQECYVGRG